MRLIGNKRALTTSIALILITITILSAAVAASFTSEAVATVSNCNERFEKNISDKVRKQIVSSVLTHFNSSYDIQYQFNIWCLSGRGDGNTCISPALVALSSVLMQKIYKKTSQFPKLRMSHFKWDIFMFVTSLRVGIEFNRDQNALALACIGYFGNSCDDIEVASIKDFGKPIDALSSSEIDFLVGKLRRPYGELR